MIFDVTFNTGVDVIFDVTFNTGVDVIFDVTFNTGVDDCFVNLYRFKIQMECKEVFWVCSALSNPYVPCLRSPRHTVRPYPPLTPSTASIETLYKKRLF